MHRPGHRPRIIALMASPPTSPAVPPPRPARTGFLAKPVEAADLAQVIDRMLVEDAGQPLDAHGRSSATTRR
jgi:hypothetical protein